MNYCSCCGIRQTHKKEEVVNTLYTAAAERVLREIKRGKLSSSCFPLGSLVSLLH